MDCESALSLRRTDLPDPLSGATSHSADPLLRSWTPRRFGWLLALFFLFAGCTSGAPTEDSEPGGRHLLPGPVAEGIEYSEPTPGLPTAPDLDLTLLDGTELELSELWTQRPTVVVFFSSWCGSCADQQQRLSELVAAHGDAVAFLGVAGRDEPAEVRDFLVEHAVGYPVALDTDQRAARHYAAEEPPLIAVIERGGGLVRGVPGGITDAEAATELDEQLRDLYRRK
ncbi:TlpA family protein disulfide reductase [Actinoalloteichus hymeniacidonis]|uniref:Thiol-disulfide isomerase-like thioredoxin n=1 Tax=Actinoalloteichus hymeniacidonis TaxID=340345 RepID=A0AAC9HPW2_9PSEU|nr:TlpA disulfide reductase family protein [Actinoalloteichus hymeniacidonis]AOS63158.1 thiol-disulfide isomerase-like thioredoxin [Actinoalloteichus hymeniacidonis]MBB5908805.1 peroxiredoxin [Actinoalloteichus hymeniacidonis]